MIPPLHLLCAELGLIGYAPGFLTAPASTAAPMLQGYGRTLRSIIYGSDPKIGAVPFGFISEGPAGVICTIRGTQMPGGSIVEWLDDFDAVLEQCPFAPTSARWHRGFGRVYSTLNVGGTPLAQALQAVPGVIVHGHSLGGPLATYAAAEGKCTAPVLYASPKCGDSALRDYLQTLPGWTMSTAGISSYANPNDAVPKVPITVDWPFQIEDFQQVAVLTELPAASVIPPIAADWDSSHQLSNYFLLLQAAAAAV